jgi:hypothetical protein
MDYMLAYLKADVVLLAEVYENYRNITLKELGVDPCRFITAASMTYFTAFKYSGSQAEVLTDPEMFKFFMEAKRGGMCSVGEINFSNIYKKGITEYIFEDTKPPQVTPKVVPD